MWCWKLKKESLLKSFKAKASGTQLKIKKFCFVATFFFKVLCFFMVNITVLWVESMLCWVYQRKEVVGSITQVYAPTSDDEDEVEQFYEQLDSIIAKTLKKDILVVQGSWNAKVGPDIATLGRDRGKIWRWRNKWQKMDTPCHHRLTLANTLHPHKLSMTATWRIPNGLVYNQIVFILTPQHFKSSINKANTRSF